MSLATTSRSKCKRGRRTSTIRLPPITLTLKDTILAGFLRKSVVGEVLKGTWRKKYPSTSVSSAPAPAVAPAPAPAIAAAAASEDGSADSSNVILGIFTEWCSGEAKTPGKKAMSSNCSVPAPGSNMNASRIKFVPDGDAALWTAGSRRSRHATNSRIG